MKFTNQFITTITLCVLAAVLMVLIGAGLSFYQMGIAYQQRQVDAVVRMVDESWQPESTAQPNIDRWLPALLDTNELIVFTVHDQHKEYYRSGLTQPLASDEISEQYDRALTSHDGLFVRLVLRPPFYHIDHSLAAVSGLTGAIMLVFAGLLLSLRWFRWQLRGAELLEQRGRLILDGRLSMLQHSPKEEWPQAASRALDKLMADLREARKERSRFDTFIRANVFVDRNIGIGNRVFFDNRLEAALNDSASQSAALLLVELQDLEHINHKLGHDRGDELLSSASVYLGHLIRRYPGALQARYTGNTFALMFPNTVESEAQEAARQVLKLLRRLHWPDVVKEPAVYIGGVCFRFGEQLHQIEEEAELALRSAALQGGDGYFMYYKGLTEESSGKGTVRWRTLLGRLLEQDAILLDRQGIYSAAEATPESIELLARIHDEQGRELAAGHFLPMAEKCGLLQDLDRCIMLQSLTALQDADRKAVLAVNLSVASILNRSFHRWLVFELIQLPRPLLHELVIELSEAGVGRHFLELVKPLRALKALGCRLAVDHVGQDVVSTQYIKDYDLDYLKLHPSLVRDIDKKSVNQMAVRSLLGNCMGNHTRVIAVGVETEAEWTCLKQLGVHAGQGYYFSCPERFQLT